MRKQFTGIFSNQFFLHFSSFGILILSVVTFYSNFTDFNFNSSFNSDSLGVINLFRDIFQEQGKLQSWRMAGSTTLFPDLSLFYLLFLIFGNDVLSITFIYGIIQVLLVTTLMCYVYRKLISPELKAFSWLIPLLFSLIFLESYYYTNDQMLPYLYTIYCYHTGTLINTLIAISISISNFKFGIKCVLLLLISFLAAFSDMLFVVMFVGPFIITNLLQFKFLGFKKTIILILIITTGVYTGNYLFKHLNETGFFIYQINIKLYSFDLMRESWRVFYDQMLYNVLTKGLVGFRTFLSFFFLILVFMTLLLLRKKLDSGTRYFLLLFVMILISLYASPIINGIYIRTDAIRYSAAAYLFSYCILAMVIAVILRFGVSDVRITSLLAALVLIITGSFVYNKFNYKGMNNYFSYYPPKVRALDSICVKNGLKNGVSDYWIGKWSTMFSKRNIRVHSVYQWTNIYEFGSNSEWYFNKEFDFVIPDRIDSAEIRKNFVILDSFRTPEILVLKVKKFVYVRNGNFLPKTLEASN